MASRKKQTTKAEPLSLSEREWRLMQRAARRPGTKAGKDLEAFAAMAGAFVIANSEASRAAESLSDMLHSDAHGMSSIQEYLDAHPLGALALLRLIRVERERGAGRLEKEAHKKMSSKGGKQRALNMGTDEKRRQIQEIWATGKFKTRDICALEECDALGMPFSSARKMLIGTPDPKA